MVGPTRGLRGAFSLLTAVLAAVMLAACGSSGSGSATSLLKQTFSGAHTVNSGNLNVSLTVNPSGSSTITGPISLSFGGPFASLGKNKLPKSDFNISISALGRTGSLGILSTGSAGYVTLKGTSYQLPPATFQQLESSFTSLTASSGGNSTSSTLGKLGINPLRWLINPTVAGNDSVGGASTTHIRAGVNVAALLGDLSTFLGKASSLGVAGAPKLPTRIAPSTQNRIANEVRQPHVDVWTGNGDKTLRRLVISLILPVTGQISSLLGGLSSAQISLSMQYADLNQPQTIVAPTNVAPFTQFQTKLRTFISNLQTTVGSAGLGTGSGSSSSSGSGSSSTGSGSAPSPSGNLGKYTQCLQSAGKDITRMQTCASLLNGG